MPWTFESIAYGYGLLEKTGSASIAKCLDIIMDEKVFKNDKADRMLRGTAIIYLLVLPVKDRASALKRVSVRAKRTKSPLARQWAQRVFDSLTTGRFAL